jgi:hypothetical protein
MSHPPEKICWNTQYRLKTAMKLTTVRFQAGKTFASIHSKAHARDFPVDFISDIQLIRNSDVCSPSGTDVAFISETTP